MPNFNSARGKKKRKIRVLKKEKRIYKETDVCQVDQVMATKIWHRLEAIEEGPD